MPQAAAEADNLPIGLLQQPLHHVAANEAGGARYKNKHSAISSRHSLALASAVEQGHVRSVGILGTTSKITSFRRALFAFRMRMISSAVTGGKSSWPSTPTS